MKKKHIIIIVAFILIIGLGIGCYFLFFNKKELTDDQLDQISESEAAARTAEAAAAEAAARTAAANAKSNIISNNSLTVEQKEEQLELIRQQEEADSAAAKEVIRRAEIDKYNASTTADKFKQLTPQQQQIVNEHINFAYNDMKGGNSHNIGKWERLELDLSDDLLFAFFITLYEQTDSINNFVRRTERQNWSYTCNPNMNGARMRKCIANLVTRAKEVSFNSLDKTY